MKRNRSGKIKTTSSLSLFFRFFADYFENKNKLS